MQCGLLGCGLSHSYSPMIHGYFGDYSYDLFDLQPDALDGFLQSGNFRGLNVTSPYKKAILPYCAELTDCARLLGSVNTIVRDADGKLLGHNTDYFGFQYLLKKSNLDVSGKKVLILGSGGASNTAVHVLTEAGAKSVVVSRTGENNYKNLFRHTDAAVIVNATPVGMFPKTGESPIDISLFPCLEGVIDLIYNPARTKLLMDAEDRGLIACNGLWMLVAQAQESSELFQNISVDRNMISVVHDHLQKKMLNTVLIGMPGSGKTSIGKMLAQVTGKAFVDSDEEIEKAAGKSIPEIFRDLGESGFREMEANILSELGKRSGQVIATGGGCVMTPVNYRHLHQNAKIIRLERSLDSLPTSGRPLSQSQDLCDMYRLREPLYRIFADHTVHNNATIQETVHQIVALEEQL